jgi:ribonuclease BN (tRNA processing enzyme)
MKLTFLGTGSIIPTRKRFASGILADVGEKLLFDCGPGTMHKLTQAGYDVNKIKYLFITHFHFDHIADYFPILLSRGVKQQTENVGNDVLNVYGPEGIEEAIKSVFEISQFRYMREHLNCTKIKRMDKEEINGYKITSVPAKHPDAIAYKIAAEKTAVYTGDTEPSDDIISFAKNADLLIHECSYPEGHVEGHTTADELGDIAKKANVKKLILNHLYPVCEGKEKDMINKIKEDFDGEVLIAEDLMVVEL